MTAQWKFRHNDGQQKRNAIFEVNQQIVLAGLYNGVFSTKLLSTVELVCAYSMDCSVSQRIWIFLFLLLTIILNLRNIFSL